MTTWGKAIADSPEWTDQLGPLVSQVLWDNGDVVWDGGDAIWDAVRTTTWGGNPVTTNTWADI